MSRYVLVLEDNPSDQMILSALVEKEQCIPVVAPNGHDGLELFDQYDFALLIVDLNMPFMGGVEFMQRARQQGIEVPVLVSSAKKEPSAVKRAIQSGASDYIVKPIDPMIFNEKVSRFLADQEKWAEYKPSADSKFRGSYVARESQLVSLSEISAKIVTNYPVSKDEIVPFGGQFLAGSEFTSLQGKVANCKQTPGKDEFTVTLSFIGISEEARKQIRIACKAIWEENQKEKE